MINEGEQLGRLAWLLTSPVLMRSPQEDMITVSPAIGDEVCLCQIVDDDGDNFLVIGEVINRVLQSGAQSQPHFRPSRFRLGWGLSCCRIT